MKNIGVHVVYLENTSLDFVQIKINVKKKLSAIKVNIKSNIAPNNASYVSIFEDFMQLTYDNNEPARELALIINWIISPTVANSLH